MEMSDNVAKKISISPGSGALVGMLYAAAPAVAVNRVGQVGKCDAFEMYSMF